MASHVTTLREFFRREEGATMVEYGLMLALIAVVCVAAVALIGTSMNSNFGIVNNSMNP